MFRKIVIGVSGGVDSAVSAFLLKNKGFNVQAAFMKNWDANDETGFCAAEKDRQDVQMICDKLNIPLVEVDFVKEYWIDVFQKFLRSYELGETPNPDINCNKYIKFNAFFHYAREILNCDAIATGHYARNSFGCFLENFDSNIDARLLRNKDSIKDQTFFLSQISQTSLRRTMFPIGNLWKCEVKKIATEIGLNEIAQKKESMGICFIGKRNFKQFISEYIDPKPGIFVDFETGQIIGKHDGFHLFTVGQRILMPGNRHKMYILKKMSDMKTMLVAGGHDNEVFYSDLLFVGEPNWIRKSPFRESEILDLRFCFQHVDPLEECRVAQIDGGMIVQLKKPLRAITPGQYAVFYLDDECLGSAKITANCPILSEDSRKLISHEFSNEYLIRKCNR